MEALQAMVCVKGSRWPCRMPHIGCLAVGEQKTLTGMASLPLLMSLLNRVRTCIRHTIG